MTFEEYEKEHLQGQSGEVIRLMRMAWNARGSYGNQQGILDGSDHVTGAGNMVTKMLPIAEKKIRQMGGEAMGVVVRRNDGLLVAVTDSGRVTRLDDAVAGPAETSKCPLKYGCNVCGYTNQNGWEGRCNNCGCNP